MFSWPMEFKEKRGCLRLFLLEFKRGQIPGGPQEISNNKIGCREQ